MHFLVSAGEASGDIYGAQLVLALRQLVPEAEFFGLGSQAMRAAGCDLVVDAREIAVVGLFEVLGRLAHIYGEFKRVLRAVEERKPDAAILIDFPDFNFRLARQLRRRGIPVFYYVSPQLWAWRSRRIKLVRQYVREMLVIFPFEETWYRQRGVSATYVGHPLADAPPPAVSRADFARQYGLSPEKDWISLLPGSRHKEVSMNLPGMIEAAHRLGPEDKYHFLLPVASTLETAWVAKLAKQAQNRVPIVLTRDARATLRHARAAVIASGTATVEAALLGIPFVMVYRVSPLTWAVGKRLVNLPFYGMVNLIAEHEVAPELVQQHFTGERVAGELQAILPDGPPRRKMLTGLKIIREALEAGRQEQSAAERAAGLILDAL